MGKKNNFCCYGVAVGRAPGVYRTWQECSAQTSGVFGAKFKGFHSQADARAFVAAVAGVAPREAPPRDPPALAPKRMKAEAPQQQHGPMNCRKCHEKAVPKTLTSQSANNPNRDYFACSKCGNWLMWVDSVGIEADTSAAAGANGRRGGDGRGGGRIVFDIEFHDDDDDESDADDAGADHHQSQRESIQLEVTPAARSGQPIPYVLVDFPYDAILVSIVRQLNPKLRDYNPGLKNWMVHISAMIDFVGMLREAPEVSSVQMDEDLMYEVYKRLLKLVPPPPVEVKTEPRAPAPVVPAVAPAAPVATLTLTMPAAMVEPLTMALYDQLNNFNPPVAAPTAVPAVRARAAPPVDCICRQPWREDDGRGHVCRVLGKFKCRSCHKKWTSAYCWKEHGRWEKQDCRKCRHANEPSDYELLVSGKGTGNPHDSSNCHRCQKLGRRCDGRDW